MSEINLGILGASGKVGRELIRLIEKSKILKIKKLKLFGTKNSAGKKTKFKNKELFFEETVPENLKELDLVISTANGEVSERFIPELLKKETKLVIDTDSYYRMDSDVPLIMAGVNDQELKKAILKKRIVASPNCSTCQLVVPLKVLEDNFGLSRVIVTTYQSVSGAGKAAMDQLLKQTEEALKNQDLLKQYEEPFAFNLIPRISKIDKSGYAKEELKVIDESRKILNKPDLKITCTAVRVPVLIGHSEILNLTLDKNFTIQEITEALKKNSYLKVWEEHDKYPMPIKVAGSEPIHIGRIRIDYSAERSLSFLVVADNLLIGAALNAIRIAEKAFLELF